MKHTRAAMFLSFATTSLTHAQSTGQWVVNADWMYLAPQDSSQSLTVHALGRSAEVSGSGSTLTNINAFTLTTWYFVTDYVVLGAVLSVPPKLHLSGAGSLAPVGELGITYAWSPAAQVQYYFGKPNVCVKPYPGVGLDYVWYRDIELGRSLAAGQILALPTTGPMLVGPTTASLSKSFALIVSVGLTYNPDAYWSIGASVSHMRLSAKATLTTQVPMGTVTTTTKVRASPLTSPLSVGYRFQRLHACLDTNCVITQLEDEDGVVRCTDLLGRGVCRHRDLLRHHRVLLCDSFDLAYHDVDLLDVGVLLGGGRRNLSRQFSWRPPRSP